MNDEVISHVFNPVLSSKSQTFEEKKTLLPENQNHFKLFAKTKNE